MFSYSIANNKEYEDYDEVEIFSETKIGKEEFKTLVKQALLNSKNKLEGGLYISPFEIACELCEIDSRFKFQHEVIEHVECALVDFSKTDKIQDILQDCEDCEIETYPTQHEGYVHFLII